MSNMFLFSIFTVYAECYYIQLNQKNKAEIVSIFWEMVLKVFIDDNCSLHLAFRGGFEKIIPVCSQRI